MSSHSGDTYERSAKMEKLVRKNNMKIIIICNINVAHIYSLHPLSILYELAEKLDGMSGKLWRASQLFKSTSRIESVNFDTYKNVERKEKPISIKLAPIEATKTSKIWLILWKLSQRVQGKNNNKIAKKTITKKPKQL